MMSWGGAFNFFSWQQQLEQSVCVCVYMKSLLDGHHEQHHGGRHDGQHGGHHGQHYGGRHGGHHGQHYVKISILKSKTDDTYSSSDSRSVCNKLANTPLKLQRWNLWSKTGVFLKKNHEDGEPDLGNCTLLWTTCAGHSTSTANRSLVFHVKKEYFMKMESLTFMNHLCIEHYRHRI